MECQPSTRAVSVLALSSRFDGPLSMRSALKLDSLFQYSLCRVVLMVLLNWSTTTQISKCFSTRSVESF